MNTFFVRRNKDFGRKITHTEATRHGVYPYIIFLCITKIASGLWDVERMKRVLTEPSCLKVKPPLHKYSLFLYQQTCKLCNGQINLNKMFVSVCQICVTSFLMLTNNSCRHRFTNFSFRAKCKYLQN